MNTQRTSQNESEEINVSLKLKLATLWASFMFLYIYEDYFHLYVPGSIKDSFECVFNDDEESQLAEFFKSHHQCDDRGTRQWFCPFLCQKRYNSEPSSS